LHQKSEDNKNKKKKEKDFQVSLKKKQLAKLMKARADQGA
jgi:hypothetical protein